MTRPPAVARLLVLLALLLAGCGGTPETPPPAPMDPALDSAWRIARFALESGNRDQAVTLYGRALDLAYARDDVGAIGDIGYEYALALLRGGQPDAASEQAVRTRAELERRDAAPFAELFLVEAVARYAADDPASAGAAARAAIDRAAADDWQTRGRAHYVLGMLAADAGDSGALAQAIAAMGAKPDPALQADRRELQGRQLALGGEHGGAVAAFGQAAALRRELRDYAGMARVLAAAGASAERTGDDAGAADYYYRAGRSAAAQDDADNARSWLATARKLAARGGQPRIAADAGQLLSTLGE